ncbi:hypothetical protein ACIQCF_30140 [Streptomyces sp. NPDC088353]|uniref:hypothetical protein n=1 Tax=Streptomyces sp. NPDC088353 TaxID=3365855 RepID=UPI0038308871
MSTDQPAGLDEARTKHEQDVATFGEVLGDVKAMIRTGLAGIEDIARKLAAVIPQVEEGQRNLRVNADTISAYAKHHGEAGVSAPDQLGELLASLDDRERRVYDEARLGAAQAARALGRHAQP